jgi:hypothetical protein
MGRRGLARRGFILVAAIPVVASCNSILGLDILKVYEGPDGTEGGASGESGASGGTTGGTPPPVDADGGATAGGDGGVVGVVVEAPCDAAETPNASSGVFVSATSGAEAGVADGSKDFPFRTITEGIAAAKAAARASVYVEQGTYAEALVLYNLSKGAYHRWRVDAHRPLVAARLLERLSSEDIAPGAERRGRHGGYSPRALRHPKHGHSHAAANRSGGRRRRQLAGGGLRQGQRVHLLSDERDGGGRSGQRRWCGHLRGRRCVSVHDQHGMC